MLQLLDVVTVAVARIALAIHSMVIIIITIIIIIFIIRDSYSESAFRWYNLTIYEYSIYLDGKEGSRNSHRAHHY